MIILTKAPEKSKEGSIVTLDEAKRQLNIEPEETEDDQAINDLILVATEMVEDDINADILVTTNTLEHTDSQPFQRLIRIVQAPLKTFTKIEQLIDGSFVEIPSANYTVLKMYGYISIELDKTPESKTLKFTFDTGFAASKIPKKLKQAVLLKVADLFDTERQGYSASSLQKNDAYQHLISKHIRKYW